MTYYSALHYAAKAEKSASEAALHNLKNKITNCITEIPQDIKLELNNGALTLKAGSKVYVPNGFEADGTTPKFDVKIVESDTTNTNLNTDTRLLFVNPQNGITREPISFCFSSSSTPSGSQYMFWYDTANNLIKHTTDSGSTWESGFSLPFSQATANSSGYISINQVFNGFGYIGSTVFALPNVKGLIPNGRNEDGSLRNIEFTTTRVMIFTAVATKRDLTPVVINGDVLTIGNPYSTPNGYRYLEDDNILFINNQGNTGLCYCGDFSISDSKIDFFKRSNAFHAVDRNDLIVKADKSQFQVVSTLPSSPQPDVFYFIPE